MDTTTLAILLGLIALAVIVGAALYMQRRRSQAMRDRYGAEYIATVDQLGDRHKVEAELRRREKRVHAFDIRPLPTAEIDRFSERWVAAQAAFVDDPGPAVGQADDLLAEVMQARGYPVSDFEQRAADLSVDHAELVANYRIAHKVAELHERGKADTEDLRRAMIAYRALFDDLLEPVAERRPLESRTFSEEETQDERTARVRDDDPRTDDRAAGERGRGPDRGRTPHV
jgi:FtsZ-interacting cell division protein ZipA